VPAVSRVPALGRANFADAERRPGQAGRAAAQPAAISTGLPSVGVVPK